MQSRHSSKLDPQQHVGLIYSLMRKKKKKILLRLFSMHRCDTFCPEHVLCLFITQTSRLEAQLAYCIWIQGRIRQIIGGDMLRLIMHTRFSKVTHCDDQFCGENYPPLKTRCKHSAGGMYNSRTKAGKKCELHTDYYLTKNCALVCVHRK